MTFIVTYRGADGAVREERVEAANRAECFSTCRAKGILPLGMEESRSDRKTRRSDRETRRSDRKARRSVLAAVLVVIVLAGVGFWLWTTRSKVTMQVVDEKPKKMALPKEVNPAKTQQPTSDTKTVAASAPTTAVESVTREGPPPGYIRLPTGRDIRCKLPPPGETKQMLIFGEMYEIDSDGNAKSLTPPVFDNRFENSVLALSSEGGGLMPGAAKMIPKDEVEKYLFTNIEIKDDDPEDVIAKKIATAEMKELLKEHLKSGGTWEDFAEKATEFRQTERALESEARMTMAKMLREGDVEGVKMYRDKVNEFLKSKGYRGLKLPKKWLDALGEQN